MKVPLGLVAVVFTLPWMSSGQLPAQARPQGPCDIYGAAGTPCVAAHSTTRTFIRLLQRSALTRAHANGMPITTSLPTPGAPNRYAAKTSTIPRR